MSFGFDGSLLERDKRVPERLAHGNDFINARTGDLLDMINVADPTGVITIIYLWPGFNFGLGRSGELGFTSAQNNTSLRPLSDQSMCGFRGALSKYKFIDPSNYR